MPRPLRSAASVLVFVTFGSMGCAATSSARAPAIDRVELVKSATFDHDCPADRIHVLDADDDRPGGSRYVVEICGTRHVYRRVGTIYFDAKRSADTASGS